MFVKRWYLWKPREFRLQLHEHSEPNGLYYEIYSNQKRKYAQDFIFCKRSRGAIRRLKTRAIGLCSSRIFKQTNVLTAAPSIDKGIKT